MAACAEYAEDQVNQSSCESCGCLVIDGVGSTNAVVACAGERGSAAAGRGATPAVSEDVGGEGGKVLSGDFFCLRFSRRFGRRPERCFDDTARRFARSLSCFFLRTSAAEI